MKLRCNTKTLDLSKPLVMGILNVTPNSFASTGRCQDFQAALSYARQMYEEGAAIIDIGGEPTNPGVHPVVSLQEELDRVLPVVEALARELPIPISVDTSKPEVMSQAIQCGADLINDVRALECPGALEAVAASKAGVCLMHMAFPQGNADNSQLLDIDIVASVKDYLQKRVTACINAGIDLDRIIIDPGIGAGSFGKNLQQNIQLIQRLKEFKTFNLPILAGVSRKTFIGELLNLPVEERLYGSLAAAIMAVNNGAAIIRCHDVRPTIEALKVAVALISVEHPIATQLQSPLNLI